MDEEQNKLAQSVKLVHFDHTKIKYIAVLDITYHESRVIVVGIVIDRELNIVAQEIVEMDSNELPEYKAGYLAYRELPCYQRIWKKLKDIDMKIDVVMIDGNGILHPRRCGSACHFGILNDIPTIGVAKNLHHLDDLPSKGEIKDQMIKESKKELALSDYGYAYLATDKIINPIYISPGHLMDSDSALEVVKMFSIVREPEPVRWADRIGRKYLRGCKK